MSNRKASLFLYCSWPQLKDLLYTKPLLGPGTWDLVVNEVGPQGVPDLSANLNRLEAAPHIPEIILGT